MSETTTTVETYVDPDVQFEGELESVEEESNETVTPYKAAGLVNKWLEEAGVEKVLPPQMFYNYTKGRINQGKKPFIEVDDKNQIKVSSLKAWFVKYLAKQVKA